MMRSHKNDPACVAEAAEKEAGRSRANDFQPLDTASSPCILSDLTETIKTRLQAGEMVHAADFPAKERAHYHAAIAMLRDALPLRVRWKTKTESALGDWKLRQRCYVLPSELVAHPKGGE